MRLLKPERTLTKKEWDILISAVSDSVRQYFDLSNRSLKGKRLSNDTSASVYWAEKGVRVSDILMKLKNEYYEVYPDEAPDRREKNELEQKAERGEILKEKLELITDKINEIITLINQGV